MPTLTSSPIHSAEDLEMLRRIRNDCREHMTGSSRFVDVPEQGEWLSGLDTRVNWPVLVHHPDIALPVGYGLVSAEGDRRWLTGGLLLEFRGRGWGRPLFDLLVSLARGTGGEPWLRVRMGNVRARSLYTRMGFKLVHLEEVIITTDEAPVQTTVMVMRIAE